MLEDVLNGLYTSKSEFDANVKDSFGRSIDETVFDPVKKNLDKIKYEYECAEAKMNEINMLTEELKTII